MGAIDSIACIKQPLNNSCHSPTILYFYRMKISVRYGLAAGLALIVWITTGYLLHWYKTSFILYWTLIGFAIQAVLVFMGIREERAKVYGGEIPYVRALLTGVLISVIGGSIYAAGNFILFSAWDYSDLQEFVLAQIEAKVPLAKQGEAKQEAILNFTPHLQAMSTFLQTFIFGLLLSLIFAMFLRKRDAPDASI